MIFRLSLALVFTSLLLAISATPSKADQISDKQQQAKAAQQQLDSLQNQMNRLASQLDATQSRLAALEDNIARNEAELASSQAEVTRLQKILSQRLVEMYKQGNSDSLEVLLDCEDLDTFLNSYDYMSRIGSRDAETIAGTRSVLADIQEKRAELDSEKAERETQLANLQEQQQNIQVKFTEQKALLDGLNGDVAALLSARYRSLAATTGTSAASSTKAGSSSSGTPGPAASVPRGIAGANGLFFPVAGPHSFVNDWGAPRVVGGTHKGTDIMAARGTPLVAVTSGTVTQHSQKNAGNYVILRGDNGDSYYYMHMDGFAASGRVSAGQPIGYVGDTGNAKGGPCHCHFEWHPGGGGPVNPYPLLRAIEG
jgi:murein DD-endopeptidase MepM/ murein hydrolase activator NlpD